MKPALFPAYCQQTGIPPPIPEHRFDVAPAGCKARRWRFDWAWPEHKIAVEVEGGVWTGGRHTSGAGFVADMEKYNTAAVLGWRVLRVQPKTLCTLRTIEMIRAAISAQSRLFLP